MVTKNGKVVTLRKAIPPINSHKHVFTSGDMTNQKQNISIIPMFTRHTKVVTYFEELLPIFLHEKFEKLLFPVSQNLWLLNLKKLKYLNFSPKRYFNILCMTGNMSQKDC